MLFCKLIISNLIIYWKFKTSYFRRIKKSLIEKTNYLTYEIVSQSISWYCKRKAINDRVYFK